MRASSDLKFHVIAISVKSQTRKSRFQTPDNLLGVTDVILDVCPAGSPPKHRDARAIAKAVQLMRCVLADDKKESFSELVDLVKKTKLGGAALLDSKAAWLATEKVYSELLPNGSLIDFFWSWRFLAKSLLAIMNTPLPKARAFHAAATGYSGLVGAFAKHLTGRPLIVTEHGIYTNERRIELAVAEWIYDSGKAGYNVNETSTELRGIWLQAFKSFSRIAYGLSDVITTQYRANQNFQKLDGAPEAKLRIIPNGIDANYYVDIERLTKSRPPTVLMIARVVPIKDVRTFIMAIARLRELVPDVSVILIGPQNEDPAYAAECRELVTQLGLQTTLQFLARVQSIMDYLGNADVVALTSISEAQPMVVLEAAASGVPVVATDVGSCREIIEGFADDPVTGPGGIVVEPCNPDAVAKALATILLDGDLRARMGRVMRERAATYYNKDRVRILYEEMYADMATP